MKGQAFGQRAKEAMSELVFGKDCRTSAAFDRPLRAPLVARVIVEGQDTGLALLKQGLRWVYEKYVGQASVEIQSRYRDAQHAAQAERAGLWQDPDRCRHWIGEKAKRNVSGRRRARFDREVIGAF